MTDWLIWLTQHPWQALALVLLIWAASHLIGVCVYAFAQARESRQRAEQRKLQQLQAAIELTQILDLQVGRPPRASGINHRRIS